MFQADPERNRDATLLHYGRILRKRQFAVYLFTLVMLVTVTVGTMLATPYYSSRATIEISPEPPTFLDVDEVAELVSGSSMDQRRTYYYTQYRVLESRTVLEAAVKLLREEHGFQDFDDEVNPVAFLRRHLAVNPELDTRLVHIRVEYTDAEKAATMANAVAEAYMNLNLQRTLDAAQDALGWLEEQQVVYRERKHASDVEVHEFTYGSDVAEREAIGKVIEELQDSWSVTRAELVEASASYRRLSSLARSEDWMGLATHLGGEDPVLARLLVEFRELQSEVTALSARYRPGWPEVIEVQAKVEGVAGQIRSQVDEILAGKSAELQVVQTRETALRDELEEVKTEVQVLDERLLELGVLEASATTNADLFTSLDERMAEVSLSKLIEANNIWFIDRAIAKRVVVRPRLGTNLPMALILGILGGMALAFFLEYLDSTVKTREDLEEVVGMPFLGAVPGISAEERAGIMTDRERNIFVHTRPGSAASECLRTIRTNVMFRTPDHTHPRLLITSAVPQEGKSFISSNLAAVIAMTGKRVLLIDADLRRPTQHKLFGIGKERGLASILIGTSTLENSMTETHVSGLFVLPAGHPPGNPAELLGSEKMIRFLDGIQGFDLVIIDSSPVCVVADPLILSPMVGGVVVVVESNRTLRDQVLQTYSRLAEMNANILGAVVNKLDIRKSGYGYYYHYDYSSSYYGPDESDQRKSG